MDSGFLIYSEIFLNALESDAFIFLVSFDLYPGGEKTKQSPKNTNKVIEKDLPILEFTSSW